MSARGVLISSLNRLENIMFHVGLYGYLCGYLPCKDIAALEAVNSFFYTSIRESEHFWRETAGQILQGKVFVPALVTRLLMPKNKLTHRIDLFSCSVRELRQLAAVYGLNLTKCFEKGDIVDVIHRREIKNKLPVESLAHFALRIAVIDRTRNCLQESELCAMVWDIRLKKDGPIGHMVASDPWWASPPGPSRSTTVHFHMDGRLTFTFEGPSAFRDMFHTESGQHEGATYYMEGSGSVLALSFGVREHVARHPTNWGWVLQSSGSVWTSFILPARGTDAFLEDGVVERLVNNSRDYGFTV